nr:Ig-like domain-containing protein [Lutibacter sp.]
MRATFIKFLVIIVLYASFFGCARRGTPTGGPKDSIPPVLVEASPALNTINFKSDKIKLVFDEYIKINELNKNLIISPPQKNEPIIFPAGTASKFISIKILDTLDANTTYAFNFGNSIVDNNEGNKFQNFKYVFSTGTYIDSLSLAGEITN